MTQLSININKIALLRNSRGHDYPNVCTFATRFLDIGAHGITLHPRPDERHARYQDVFDLKKVCKKCDRELNVEGYPADKFLEVVLRARPAQCTLVPDDPGQLTSDHGWDLKKQAKNLVPVIAALKEAKIRVSLFVDYDNPDIPLAKKLGADRVELYTEPYAESYGKKKNDSIFKGFLKAVRIAQESGLGVNAGHDLNLINLPRFLEIPGILEVSIGHALITECLESGMKKTVRKYLEIVNS